MKAAGLGDHYAIHDNALFYHNASGVPWTATYIQAKGDPIADFMKILPRKKKQELPING